MGRIYRAGTRTSPLALRQVEEIVGGLKSFYPTIKVEMAGIETHGDRDKTTPISQVEGSDFFTREIDEMLLVGKIDFAVHSAKDLPDDLQKELSIAAITGSIDPYDVLVSKSGLKLPELPYGARIGTSSLRRKEALKRFRSDFQIIDIRGNIGERLKLLDNGGTHELEAIIIAAAGLIRLGLGNRITQKIPFEILRPHPLQGALAVVARTEDSQLRNLLSVIDSREAISL